MRKQKLQDLILNNGTGVVTGTFRLLIPTWAFTPLWKLYFAKEVVQEDLDRAKREIDAWGLSEQDAERAKTIAGDYRVYVSSNNQSLGSFPIDPQGTTKEGFNGIITLNGEDVWIDAKFEDESELFGTFTAYRYLSMMGGVEITEL